VAGLMNEVDGVGWVGWEEAIRPFSFVTDVRIYLHRWSWSYGLRDWDWDWVWDHRSFSSIYPIAAEACRCKIGLEWIGLDSLKTMDTPFLLSVSPSSSSHVCLSLSSSSRSVIETDERRRRLSSCWRRVHPCPANVARPPRHFKDHQTTLLSHSELSNS